MTNQPELNTLFKRHVYPFQSLAMDYFREYISYGKTLSKLFLEKVDLKEGSLSTFISKNINPAKIENFTWSFSSQPTVKNIKNDRGTEKKVFYGKEIIENKIQEFLDYEKNKICIFEDSNSTPQDPIWTKNRKTTIKIFFEDKEVYYPIVAEQTEIQHIDSILNLASSWLTIGFLTSLPEGQKLDFKNERIDLEKLNLLATRVESVILGAFDGESFFIWEKIN